MNDGADHMGLVPAATAALVAAAGPIGSMAEGILGAPDRKLSRVMQKNFEEFIWESFADHKERLGDIEDEQERLRRLVEWLEAEVAALGERLGKIEESVMAKALHASVKAVFEVWTKMEDPEMFSYLSAALRSLAIRRDRFRGSVAPRLLGCLSELRSDHVEMLRVIWREEQDRGLTAETFEKGFGPYRHHTLKVLISAGLLDGRAEIAEFRGGRAASTWLTPLAYDFLRFIEILKDDASLPAAP